jgi:hypothetical protein
MQRKENDINTIEERENLIQDTKNTERLKNRAMEYIKNDAIKHLEELRVEFIKTNNIHREEQVTINRVFNFLKNKA